MIAFDVKDMTCGHCVSTLSRALEQLDANARIRIDLASRRVEIDAADGAVQAAAFADAIRAAGYTPSAVEASATSPVPSRAGGCCGCCR